MADNCPDFIFSPVSQKMEMFLAVKTYPNKKELLNAYLEYNEAKGIADTKKVESFSYWGKFESNGESVPWCVINVIEPEEKTIADSQCKIGHEIMHCIYGQYHRSAKFSTQQ